MTLAEPHKKVLAALVDGYFGDHDYCFLAFKRICTETGLDRKQVRRSCRLLARKGLAQFGFGLWNDDGNVAGSGYAATRDGAALVRPPQATDL